jgi:hypothetical protein
MLWLKRTPWLAAWCVWLWLGFGLYRELPRDLGPVVARFPKVDLSFRMSFKFIGASHEIYTHESRGRGKASTIRIWDGDSGNLLRTFEHGPISQTIDRDFSLDVRLLTIDPPFDDCWLCERHSLLVASKRPSLDGSPPHDGHSVMDLRIGAWIDLSEEVGWEPRFHHWEPWAVYSSGKNEFVVDLRTGAILFRRINVRPDFRWDPTPFSFFVGADRVAVPLSKPWGVNEGSDSQTYEIWTIPPSSEPTKVFTNLPRSARNDAANGRIAWLTGSPEKVVVFDVNEEKTVFVDQPPDGDKPKRRAKDGVRDPALSLDGRRILSMDNDLRDVDSGRLLWSMQDPISTWLVTAEMTPRSVDPDGRFEVHEQWGFFNAKGEKKGTFAVRSLEDGGLLYRCWHSTIKPEAEVSKDGKLVLDSVEGVVRSLPPHVNWPLLALCQTILASPLVLLWAILRWRRRRMERRSMAA